MSSLLPERPAFHFDPSEAFGEPRKAVTSTSRAAYRQIEPSLPAREAAVLEALKNCHQLPTAYELFDFMKARGLAKDLNDVRPRLTALHKRGLIRRMGQGACAITGKTAFTWEAVSHAQ